MFISLCFINIFCLLLCLVVQLCPTLCDPMNCSPPGSSVQGDSPGKNTGVGCHTFLQVIFPTQGLNPGLLHFRQILHHLSYPVSPDDHFSFWSFSKDKRLQGKEKTKGVKIKYFLCSTFHCSFNNYFLSPYSILDPIRGVRDMAVKKDAKSGAEITVEQKVSKLLCNRKSDKDEHSEENENQLRN